MKNRFAMIPAIFTLVAGCSGKTLTVGSGPNGATADGEITCAPSDCADYTPRCSDGKAPVTSTCHADTSPQFLPGSLCTLTPTCASGAALCSWTPTACSGGGPCSVPSGGGGVVSVLVPPPGTPGAETTLTAYFNHGVDTGGQSFGACVFDPDGAILTQSGVVGAPAPRPGVVTVTAKGFTESITPACDGTYATGSTSETIEPGSLVTFGFGDQKTAGSGDDFPTSFPGVPAPHFVTLASTDRLTAASPKVSRASDLGVDWTVSGTPLSLESVVVLWTQKSATLTCTFDASAGTGVVPADALLQLDKGSASFAVQSVHEADDGNPDEGGWGIRLLVQMPASTPTGLAVGSATLE